MSNTTVASKLKIPKIDNDIIKLLLVEGLDEKNFFESLIRKKFPEQLGVVQVIDCGGKDKFHDKFDGLSKDRNFRNISTFGFVRDAETFVAKSAFDSVCTTIFNVTKKLSGNTPPINIPIPTEPGKVITEGGKTVGVFIMPDNKNTGMLEDLCLHYFAESEKREQLKCLDAFIACTIGDKNIFTASEFKKAKIQALLAVQQQHPPSIGLAAQNDFFNFDHNCFFEIKKFLKNLFSPGSAVTV